VRACVCVYAILVVQKNLPHTMIEIVVECDVNENIYEETMVVNVYV
jgi:hypothetical protein